MLFVFSFIMLCFANSPFRPNRDGKRRPCNAIGKYGAYIGAQQKEKEAVIKTDAEREKVISFKIRSECRNGPVEYRLSVHI